MKRLAVVLAAVLVSLGLGAPAGAVSSKIRPTIAMSFTPTVIQTGGSSTLTVRVRNGAPSRPVTLERYAGGYWRTVTSKRLPARGVVKVVKFAVGSDVSGAFTFRARTSATRVKGKAYRAATSRGAALIVNPARGTTPSDPFSVGEPFVLGAWQISLSATDTDAWPEIQAENMYNDPPNPGWSYVTVPVTTTRMSGDPESPFFDLTVEFLGNDHKIYGRTSDDNQWCGVVPNNMSTDDLYPGGTTTGNACAVVPTSAISGGHWRVSASGVRTSDYSTAYRFVNLS